MAKLEIITLPDPILRQTSAPVEQVDSAIIALMDDMLETMYAAPGIGLAAVQVAVPKRVIVIDIADEEENEPRAPLCMVNPKILKLSDTMRSYEEGCLSMPDVLVEIERPDQVTVEYVDRDGKVQVLTAEGILAIAVQHELNHLDGKLIIDFLSNLKRDMVVRKFKKQSRPVS